MKVYSMSTKEQVAEYEGRWYLNSCQPQPLAITIYSDTRQVFIDPRPLGGGMSQDEFDGKVLNLPLIGCVYSLAECAHIIESLKPITDKLLDTYEEYYDYSAQIDKGLWDEDLIAELENAIKQIDDSDLFYDETGIMGED